MPRLRDFLEAGVKGLPKSLSQKGVEIRSLFQEYGQGEQRTLLLRLRSRKGSEEFGFYVDTGTWEINITDSYALPDPTVRLTVLDEDFMWELVSRRESLFSAYFKSLPIEVEGPYVLRDLVTLDRILELIYNCLLADGIDLAAILALSER